MNPCPKPISPGRKPPKRIERHVRPHKHRAGKLAAMKEQADRLWSLLVLRRAGGRCEYPVLGIFGRCPFVATDAAHIFSRGHENTRLDLENGIALCRQHHELLKSAMVGKPSLMGVVVKQLRGEDLYARIEALAAQRGKFHPEALVGLKAKARNMVRSS